MTLPLPIPDTVFWRCTVSLVRVPMLLYYGETAKKHFHLFANCAKNVSNLKKDMIHAFF